MIIPEIESVEAIRVILLLVEKVCVVVVRNAKHYWIAIGAYCHLTCSAKHLFGEDHPMHTRVKKVQQADLLSDILISSHQVEHLELVEGLFTYVVEVIFDTHIAR